MKKAIRIFTVIIFLYVDFVLAQAPVTPTEQELIEPYISISPDYFYPLEEILYIEGRAEPKAIVTVLLQRQGDKPVKFTVKADSAGEWVVSEKTYLAAGNWEVRARQQVGTDISDWSNPRVIRSVSTGVSIFGLNVRYVVLAVTAFIFLSIIAFLFIYFRRRISQLQRGLVAKQLKETEERFHHGFAEIRRDLMDQLRDLAIHSQGRSLTAEEIEKRDHILRELEEMEQNLEHDIGALGDTAQIEEKPLVKYSRHRMKR